MVPRDQGLRAAHGYLSGKYCADATVGKGGNAKGKAKDFQYDGVRLVLLVERAERLRETMAEVLVPLTRLQELVRDCNLQGIQDQLNDLQTWLDLSVVFVSEVDWDNVKPPLGAAPDPYFIDIPPLTKESTSKLPRVPRTRHSFILPGRYCHFHHLSIPYTNGSRPEALSFVAPRPLLTFCCHRLRCVLSLHA